MKLIRHYVGGLLIFALLTTLVGGIYSSFDTHYDFNETYTGTDGTDNIADRLTDLGIVQSLDSFTKGIYQISNPSGLSDIIGGLMSTAFGVLGLIFTTFTLPIEIFGIVTGFYYIPPVIPVVLGTMVLIYLGFIYLSARSRGEL